jgi:mannitol operon transcriptional antiterminator
MPDAKISFRMKNILFRICQESDYVTISTIAKDLGVSTKTILRELDEVEQWLESRGCGLSKKTGTGIKVTGNEDRKRDILHSLRGAQGDNIHSPQERQTILISELLQNQQPVKLYNFAVQLKVTEGTISNDLDKAEPWFVKHGLTLVRKPGLGAYVDGPEQNIRKAMVQFIYENVDENQLLNMVRHNLTHSSTEVPALEIKTRKRLLNLIDQDVIRKLETSIREVEAKLGSKLADSAYVALTVHLALALQRIQKNEEITIDKALLAELKKYPEFVIASDMAISLTNHFSVTIPEDEVGYITMHLKGSKSREDYLQSVGVHLGSFELVKLAKEMIKIASIATGYELAQNEDLLVGLVNHLGPSISRLKMNMDIRNPMLANIQTSYPELLEISRKCVRVVEKQIGIPMPESEIAYIAMHLGAAVENCKKLPKRLYRCAIACSTGVGTSRLLVTRIAKEYDNLEIVDVISTLYIEENWLREHCIDFIISTVAIENCPVPVITVNPLLFEEDKDKVNILLAMLKNKAQFYPVKKTNPLQLKDKLVLLKQYNKAIQEIMDNFFLLADLESATVDDIIEKVSTVLEDNTDNQTKLAHALRQREAKGGTFVTGQQLILLHCRTAVVKHLRFGAVKVGKDIRVVNGKGEEEAVKLGIVMLVPDDCNEIDIETISHVSRMLLERPRFTKSLRDGIREGAYKELCNMLEDFYKIHHNKLMGA